MKKILVVDNTFDPPAGCPDIRALLEQSSQSEFQVESIRAPEGKIPSDFTDLAGVVLSGSKTRIEEDSPWIQREMEFIRTLYRERVPTFGICYGEQLIAKTLVGVESTGTAKCDEYGWVEISLNQAGSASAMFAGIEKSFYSYQAHSDEVFKLNADFEILASSERCPVQAFEARNSPMWGVQFHPEKTLQAGNAAIDAKLKKNPNAVVFNRERSDEIFQASLGQRIFANFLSLVRKSKK